MRVIIQPSYGNRETRRHWADTLDRLVPYREPRYDEPLTAAERTALADEHPDGLARFWGATAQHDRKMDTLARGDVVLLTGQKHVRAVGAVGCRLRNDEFARRLWTPDPARCLWRNVYSFRVYVPTWLRYEEIWALPGFNVNDNFMGLRFLTPEKSATVLTGLDLQGLLTRPAVGDCQDPGRVASMDWCSATTKAVVAGGSGGSP
ncbi:hypothetical protein [Actinophytocola oryzae]|uniref:Uncharacterized protein n=1 Tax=Actinophytocola oryzae TaxID=502181 RepID=A0A4R7VHA7_9PSEU|nr:hypothetical protein [Actinophytocola oryzae]TDV48724.1 hypothetical protein CLV71_10884 [Actinophytocola oryzae]